MQPFTLWLCAFVPSAAVTVSWVIRKELKNFLNRGK